MKAPHQPTRVGWLVSVAGLAGMVLLIWLAGPYLGIAHARPLAGEAARLAAIALLLAGWMGWWLFQSLRARRGQGKRSGDHAGEPGHTVRCEHGERDAAAYARSNAPFPELVRILRGSASRRGLTWYAVIGPPGSGKSTLLRSSGLCFPLPAEAPRGMDGDRHGGWWLADQAVLLDTGPRYAAPASARDGDTLARVELLKLLHQQRRRLPAGGVILTMSASDLLTSDRSSRDECMHLLRGRLDELARHLRVGLPIYLVFTKCDLVAGFNEYFHHFNAEQRGQVWGVSFAPSQSMDGSAVYAFAGEFKLLLERLAAGLFDRLHAERDGPRRAAILAFPQQFAALGEMARQFVEGVFGGHASAAALMLRGAYFTSGVQQGTPVDLVMSAVSRTFGLDAARARGAARAQRRTFFAERLLKQLVFREAGFAGNHPALKRRRLLRQLACCTTLLAATGLLLLGLAGSHARNRDYLVQVQAALADLPERPAAPVAKERTYLTSALRRLETLSSALDVAQQHRGHVPMLMRMGLYQGRAVGDELRDAYARELNASLLPVIAAQFRMRLLEHAGDPQALYYYLKAYLMLGRARQEHAAELATLARHEWQRLLSGEAALQKALDRHFQALVGPPGHLRAQPLDNALVEQARSTLRSADLAALIYGSLRLDLDSSDHAPLLLDKELGLLGHVLRRRSGVPLSQPLPALYTQAAFADAARQGIDGAVQRFAQDDWVLGARPIDALERAGLSRQVLALYEQDYIANWDALLDDLQWQSVADLPAASALAAKLAGPSSPLKLLLKLVRDNTHDLLRSAPAADAPDTVRKRLSGDSRAALANTVEGAPAGARDQAGKAIGEHFDALNRHGEGAPGAAPIDRTLAVLDQLARGLLTPGDAGGGPGQINPQLLLARQQAAQLPAPLSGWMASFVGRSEALVAGGAMAALDEQFQHAVANDCGDFVHGRYPFSPDSRDEIPLQNFGEMFGYGGRFDALYQQGAAKLIDTGGKAWRWKNNPGAATGLPGMPAQMQSADRIKQKYFRGGPLPEVGFTLLAPTLDPGIGRLVVDVDGQEYDYRPGGAASIAMKWPGPAPGHVSITAYGVAGQLLGKLDYLGDWALFRALQAARLQRQSGLRFVARLDFDGKGVALPLQAGNLKHPFLDDEVVRFRCAGQGDAA